MILNTITIDRFIVMLSLIASVLALLICVLLLGQGIAYYFERTEIQIQLSGGGRSTLNFALEYGLAAIFLLGAAWLHSYRRALDSLKGTILVVLAIYVSGLIGESMLAYKIGALTTSHIIAQLSKFDLIIYLGFLFIPIIFSLLVLSVWFTLILGARNDPGLRT